MSAIAQMVNRVVTFTKVPVPDKQAVLKAQYQAELEQLKKELAIKEEHFNLAVGEFIDIAAAELEASRKRYDLVVREYKQLIGLQLRPVEENNVLVSLYVNR